jgi:hypothetical protein
VVVGEVPDGLGLVEQLYATLHQRIFDLGDLLEEAVGYGLVAQRPQPLRWHKLRRARGKELKVYPFRELDLPARVPAGLIEDQEDAFVLPGSHLFGKLMEGYRGNSSLLTVGAISQYTSPVVGLTKP